MKWLLESNDTSARLWRTILQGVIAVVISWLLTISTTAPEIVSLLVVPVIMAILSPIMAFIGEKDNENEKPGGTE